MVEKQAQLAGGGSATAGYSRKHAQPANIKGLFSEHPYLAILSAQATESPTILVGIPNQFLRREKWVFLKYLPSAKEKVTEKRHF